MKWIDTCWSAYNMVVNTALNATISTLNTVGSLACMAGGAAFSLSFEMDETVTGSYYAAADISGEVTVGADIPQYQYSFNTSLPFHHYLQKDGDLSYSLTDFVQPATIRTTSAILSTAGTALRLVSANLRTWQQSRSDERFLKEQHRVNAIKPSFREYLYVNAESLASSLSYVSMGSAVTSAAIQWSGLPGSVQSITFPYSGKLKITSKHYTGPVTTALIPLEYTLDQNATMDLPIIHIPVEVEEKVNAQAVANTTYGGGVFFRSHSKADFPVAVPAVLGTSAYLASNFFAGKAQRLRDERLIKAEQEGFDLIN